MNKHVLAHHLKTNCENATEWITKALYKRRIHFQRYLANHKWKIKNELQITTKQPDQHSNMTFEVTLHNSVWNAHVHGL